MVVDDQLFGIPILQVQDIVEASRITPVPLAPSAIAGVLNLRGRIVTVIDLRKLLGNFDEVPWDSQMGVTVEYKGDLYTLLVDAIGDVRTLPKRDFDKAPSTMEDKVRRICSGIFRLRGNLLVVLDVSRILLPEAIEATPMLTVEERRTRKDAARQETEETKSDKRRQLSALMTDLNAYERDFDNGLDSLGETDDIKSRKKANRNRRPVAERWQEVLAEKSRREGTTVFRMREPDEETLEAARDEAHEEQDAWEVEWQARQAGTYQSRLADEQAGAESGPDQAEMPSDTDPSGMSEIDPLQSFGAADADADAKGEEGSKGLLSDWWGKMRGKSDAEADAPDTPAEEPSAKAPAEDDTPAGSPKPGTDAAASNQGDAGDSHLEAPKGAAKRTRKKTSSSKSKSSGRTKKK